MTHWYFKKNNIINLYKLIQSVAFGDTSTRQLKLILYLIIRQYYRSLKKCLLYVSSIVYFQQQQKTHKQMMLLMNYIVEKNQYEVLNLEVLFSSLVGEKSF